MGFLGNGLGWPHLLIILALVLLLFGGPKLPGLAKSLGQSLRIFKGEMKAMKSDSKPDDADSATHKETSDETTPQVTSSTESNTDQAADTKPPSKP